MTEVLQEQNNATGWFRQQITERIKTGRNVLGASTGDLGSGKTYWCLRVAEEFDRDFSIDNVVFTANKFIHRAKELKPRKWLVYDEPGVTLSNRAFMSATNMITNFFLQSSRYRQINALFALPSLNLMDIAARTILLFQANMLRRGVAVIYRINRNQFGQTPPFYTSRMGIVEVAKPSPTLVKAYEEKRRDWHETSFKDAGESDSRKPEVIPFNLLSHLKAHKTDYMVNGKVSAMKIVGKQHTSLSTAYRMKAMLDEADS